MPSQIRFSHVGLLLIATFLFLDGYMAAFGHIEFGGAPATSHHEMSTMSEGAAHRLERDKSIAGPADSEEDHDRGMWCGTTREAIQTTVRMLEQTSVNLAFLPLTTMAPCATASVIGPLVLRPAPAHPPSVQRALFQVYRM